MPRPMGRGIRWSMGVATNASLLMPIQARFLATMVRSGGELGDLGGGQQEAAYAEVGG